jgi:hypothetical protein
MDHCDVVREMESQQPTISWVVIEEVESALEVSFP